MSVRGGLRLAAGAALLLIALPTPLAAFASGPQGTVIEPSGAPNGPAKTIALDPGHGGPDPGAADGGLVERDVNLQGINKKTRPMAGESVTHDSTHYKNVGEGGLEPMAYQLVGGVTAHQGYDG